MKTILFAILIILTSCSPILKVGLIADPQYADRGNWKTRHYKSTLNKLPKAIEILNKEDVDFVQILGDVIDRDLISYDSILPLLDQLNCKYYNLLGNHDHKPYYKKLGMPNSYYSYDNKGYHFIVLDNWGFVEGQKEWLIKELKHKNIILFSHLSMINDNHSFKWHDKSILKDIKESKIKAFIHGHNHKGSYDKKGGAHHIGITAMVEGESITFAILEIYKNKMKLKGYGNQKNLLILR